jgi:hypothetical protein
MGFLGRFFRKDKDITLTPEEKRFDDEICARLDDLYKGVIEAKKAAGSIVETPGWTEAIKNAHYIYKALLEGAVESVQDFLDKEDFARVEKGKLFHELLILNFCIIDKVYSEDKDKNLINAIFKTHFHIHNLDSSMQEIERNLIMERFNSYNGSWDNNAGGMQFIFALKVNNNIFGNTPKNIDITRSFFTLAYTLLQMKYYYVAKKKIKNDLLKAFQKP